MSAEGMFHDAHEVYIMQPDEPDTWIATFATKGHADWYVKAASAAVATVGLRPAYKVAPV
jgi:hypothetical protein